MVEDESRSGLPRMGRKRLAQSITKNGKVKTVIVTIGFELYRLAWCPCIRTAEQRDCTNFVIVEMEEESLKGWARFRKYACVKKGD